MATVIPPHRTAEQRREALVLANKVRIATADERRAVRALASSAGALRVADLLEEVSPVVAGLPVGRLLLSIRKVGPKRVLGWLACCDVRSSDRRVDQLSERQRVRLALLVREFGRRKAAGK